MSSNEVGRGRSSHDLYGAAEFVEFVERACKIFACEKGRLDCDRGNNRIFDQAVIYPEDSLIAEWMNFSRAQEESADVFLLGAIIVICAGILARRIWMSWGCRRKYPNVFSMIVGKPGDRKSSAILLAESLARLVLPSSAFLPASFSPEAMFDEYSVDRGGQADKIWIVDDANSTLIDWRKSANGARVATRFLELYDCKSLSENFRRNKRETEDGVACRIVPETSTSLLFGSTFQVAAFQGQEVRAGMARRFIYYVAEQHGRIIERPRSDGKNAFEKLTCKFRSLLELDGEIDFDENTALLWRDYQRQNREDMNEVDPLREAELSRLGSAPMQTLSIAMIFEACRQAGRLSDWNHRITADTLLLAINHVEACLMAAKRLDLIANRAEIEQDAEVFLAKLRHAFPMVEGFHFATRSAITKHFCPNSGRIGSWRPDDIYLRLIPTLERQGQVCLVDKTGKREIYAFRAEQK